MQLSVIVPFLNEREVLPACLQRLRRVLDGLNESYEIVFVDDGSRDGSAEFLAADARNPACCRCRASEAATPPASSTPWARPS